MIRVQKEPIAAKAAEITEDDVVSLADISEFTFDMERLPEPEKKSLDLIYKDVEGGKIAIPKFQRYWTWQRPQIEEL